MRKLALLVTTLLFSATILANNNVLNAKTVAKLFTASKSTSSKDEAIVYGGQDIESRIALMDVDTSGSKINQGSLVG